MKGLVIGASGGIGRALVQNWVEDGLDVAAVSRGTNGLDLTDPDSVDRVLGRLRGPFHRVVVATGILVSSATRPEKTLAEIQAAEMTKLLAVNTVGVALVLRHLPRLLPRNSASATGVLTARVGSIADNKLGGWYGYRASKAAANMLVRGAAVEIGRTHRNAVIAALHPGTVETAFTSNYPGHTKMSAETAAAHLTAVLTGLEKEQNGGFYDYNGAEVPW